MKINPWKMWKYNEKDFDEATLYDTYHKMYEDCFEHCGKYPWTIVPADQNWYKEFIMLKEITDALRSLDMQFPGLKQK